ncbi:MAG: DUF45 domain-containing protein, partial [Miltoncostaeaceae bacterium]
MIRSRRPSPRTRPGSGARPRRLVETPAGPVPCLVVRHPGARRLTLRHHAGDLRLTVPARTPEREIAAFLAANSAWIAERVGAGRPRRALADADVLALGDGVLNLNHSHGHGPSRARREGAVLRVRTPAGVPPDAVVERWYRAEAARVLGARARARAAELGVAVAGVSIRDPRSRWGSCSAAGRLSLSWRLLLAPEWIADHVVDHEVCHLVHLDHSPAFWSLLRAVDPRT